MSSLPDHLYSSLQSNAGAAPKSPPAGNGGTSSDATSILFTSEDLSLAARVLRSAWLMKDKSYRVTPIGQEVGRFLRKLRWEDKSQNTLDSYETTLARLSLDFADRGLADLTTEDLEWFLDEHWGDTSPATRTARLAAVKSFYRWAVKYERITEDKIEKVTAPKKRSVDRQAYSPAIIDLLRDAQESLRDQIGVQLLGRLGLRRNELRLMQVKDFRLDRGTVRVHGKGGKIVDVPIGFKRLRQDVEVYIIGRGANEYLIYPKRDMMSPMTNAGIHYWFKRCLKAAGLSESMIMHEMRHSAADNLWRQTGNLTLAQKLLRHASPGTTAAYLHPSMDDLEDALASLDGEGRFDR